MEGTFEMHRIGRHPRVEVSADGRGVVSHAGIRLLTDIADATGLISGFSNALVVAGRQAGGHDRGRVAVDIATMLVHGGQAITDLAVLRGVPQLFGPVASDATAWRLLDSLDTAQLNWIRAARPRRGNWPGCSGPRPVVVCRL